MPQVTFAPVQVTARDIGGSITYYVDGKLLTGVGVTIPLASLADYARGSFIRGGVASWEAYDAKTNGAALIGDGTDIVSDLTPTWAGLHTFSAGIVVSTTVGIGAALSGTGYAKLEIKGTDGATSAHVQLLGTDAYPIVQILPWGHDNAALSFDAFYGAGAWKSSDAGSNFQIEKRTDILRLNYDSAVAQGGAITWNAGIALTATGNVGIRTTTEFGSGVGVVGIADAGTNPSATPTNAFALYSAGARAMIREDANRYIVQAVASTKTTGGAPYANDGYVEAVINGTTVRLMTTA